MPVAKEHLMSVIELERTHKEKRNMFVFMCPMDNYVTTLLTHCKHSTKWTTASNHLLINSVPQDWYIITNGKVVVFECISISLHSKPVQHFAFEICQNCFLACNWMIVELIFISALVKCSLFNHFLKMLQVISISKYQNDLPPDTRPERIWLL